MGVRASRNDLNKVIISGEEYQKGRKTDSSSLYCCEGAQVSAKASPWKEAHLAMFDFIPPFDEVLHNVKNNRAIYCHVHLAPHVSLGRTKELLTGVHRAMAYEDSPRRK